MIDINTIKNEVIERLIPLHLNKIILFGSYANGNPNEDSDIDLFLLKDDLTLSELKNFELEANRKIRDLIFKYKISFDILSYPTERIYEKEDYFYKVDILTKGIVWYEQKVS